MSDPISQLGLTCPSGGDFYICQGNSTQFLGCCTSDPCKGGKGDCPQSDLRTSSFNESAYSDIKSQACSSSSAGKWYTCSQLKTPFLGCCSTNACDDGCPTKDLLAARLSDNKQSAAVFEQTSATTTTTAAATTSSTSVTSTTVLSSASATATEAAGTHSANSSDLSTGTKVGIAVGSAIVIAALLAALVILGRRYLRKRRGVVVTGSPPSAMSAMMSNPTNSYIYHDPNRILHTPPPFSSPSLEPLAAAHANRTTAESDAYHPHRSVDSSPSLRGVRSALSRRGSVSSSAGVGLQPASPQQQQEQPLRTMADLDGGNGLETPRSLSEMPCSPSWSANLQSHSPSMYRPYRPSMQEFQDPKSGLYP